MCSKKIILTIVCAAAVLTSCAGIKDMVGRFVQKPEIDFKDVSLEDLSLTGGTVVFNFTVKNTNPVPSILHSVRYDLMLNGRNFTRGVITKGIQLQPGATGELEVPVTVDFLDVFDNIMDFVSRDTVNYRLSGSVGLGPVAIPYSRHGSFNMPRLPDISLRQVSVDSLSLTGAKMVLDLELDNSNPFALDLAGFSYELALGAIPFADGATEAVPSIAEADRSTVTIPVNVNFFKLGRAAYNLLREESANYDLRGEFFMTLPKRGKTGFPFRKTGQVPFVE